MPAPIATQGDLCLINGGSITGAANSIDVGNRVFISGPVAHRQRDVPGHGGRAGRARRTCTRTTACTPPTSSRPAASARTRTRPTSASAFRRGAKILGIKVQLERMASACCNAVQTITETGSPTPARSCSRERRPAGRSARRPASRTTRAPSRFRPRSRRRRCTAPATWPAPAVRLPTRGRVHLPGRLRLDARLHDDVHEDQLLADARPPR